MDRQAAASHPRGLFSRGSQQPADGIGVRDDMMDGRDAGEPGVCRHERLGSCRMRRCGQDRVERAEARSFLEHAQPFADCLVREGLLPGGQRLAHEATRMDPALGVTAYLEPDFAALTPIGPSRSPSSFAGLIRL